jgi:ankyrin repeat protein
MIEILVHHGSNIDCVDNDGRTPLILATRAGHLSAVKALIVLKANPYLKDQVSFHKVLTH